MNILRFDSSVHQSLNHHVSVQSSAVDHAASGSAVISELLHQRTILVKECVQVRIVN